MVYDGYFPSWWNCWYREGTTTIASCGVLLSVLALQLLLMMNLLVVDERNMK